MSNARFPALIIGSIVWQWWMNSGGKRLQVDNPFLSVALLHVITWNAITAVFMGNIVPAP